MSDEGRGARVLECDNNVGTVKEDSIKNVMDQLTHPEEEYTPIPFWFFNDAPDRERIKKQLQDFKEKGVNGFVLHPRIGVPKELEYLSTEYFEVVRYIVETASELNMKVVLYDEAMYPSGSAHGLVVKEDPEYAAKGIVLTDQPGKDPVIVKLSENQYIVYTFTHGTIRGIHFGEDDGESDAPKAADILNPAAVDTFIHLTHDRYYDALQEYFGNTVIGFFTDEPSELGRCSRGFKPWYLGLDEELVKAGGILEELAALYEKKENKTTKIYHRLIKRKLADVFYKRLSVWCEQHGIAFMGHPAQSDDVEEQKYFHIPGQDLIQRRIEPLGGGIYEADSLHPKLAADLARQLGRNKSANECFGVCHRKLSSWYFTAQDMKWYIGWLGMRGVSLFIPHAFFYSVEGARKEERPPDVGPHNIWWQHYRYFSDAMKRFSYLNTNAENVTEVAVLCDNNNVPCEEIAWLYENQIGFDYLPLMMLSKSDNKALRYKKIIDLIGVEYDPALTEHAKVYKGLSGLSEFKAESDALRIVKSDILEESSAPRIVKSDILEESSAPRIVKSDIPEESNALKIVKSDIPCKDLRAVHLKKCGVDVYLFSNEGSSVIDTKLTLPAGEYIWMDLWNAAWYHWNNGQQMVLRPCDCVVVIPVDEGTLSQTMLEGILSTDAILEITAGSKRVCSQTDLGDLTAKFTLLKKNNNQACYEYVLNKKKIQEAVAFSVRGEEMAECYCNGQFAGVSFSSPHEFHIGAHLLKNTNTIRIVMTGSAANVYNGQDIFYGLE